MPDFFETMIMVDDAHYDEETHVILIFITVLMTGEKKILVEPKDIFHCGGGETGEFPDRLMHQRVRHWLNLRGKRRRWRLHTDAKTEAMNANTVETIAKRVGAQMEEITNVVSNDERIMDRKKDDLVKAENKKKAQGEAIQRLREKLKEDSCET